MEDQIFRCNTRGSNYYCNICHREKGESQVSQEEIIELERLCEVVHSEYNMEYKSTVNGFLDNNLTKLFFERGELLSGGSLKKRLHNELNKVYLYSAYFPVNYCIIDPTVNKGYWHSYANFMPSYMLKEYISSIFNSGICLVKKGRRHEILNDSLFFPLHLQFLCKVIHNYCNGIINKESEPFIYKPLSFIPNEEAECATIVSNLGVNIKISAGLLNDGFYVTGGIDGLVS